MSRIPEFPSQFYEASNGTQPLMIGMIDRASALRERIREVQIRITDISNRTLGSESMDKKVVDDEKPMPDGYMNRLEDILSDINDIIGATQHQLVRLEQAL